MWLLETMVCIKNNNNNKKYIIYKGKTFFHSYLEENTTPNSGNPVQLPSFGHLGS